MTTRETLSVCAIVLAGGALGFLTGTLIAPDAGHRTRRRLARRFEDERDELLRRGRRALSDAAERLGDGVEDVRRRAARVVGS